MLKSLSTLMQDKQSLEVGVGPKDGLIIKIVQQQVQNGLIQQIRADPHFGDQANKLQQAERTAATATSQLVPQGLRRPETVVKVLWVDDHPQNNIGLQYAFEALGLTVICIEGDARIPE